MFSQAEERTVQKPQGKNEPGVFQQEKMGITRGGVSCEEKG